MNLPQGHQTIMPYLMLNGASKFIEFLKDVFNAQLNSGMYKLAEDGTVRHAEIAIGGSTIMFTEATDQWPVQTANLFVYVENADQTYIKALESGGTSIMELSDQDYGRTCGVNDSFGNTWWITSVSKV
ncbi:MAG TPA: VOC family protein [Cytophagaceae bacterium]|jgi:uncharacterized glyoxalase superfamily protein PhnB